MGRIPLSTALMAAVGCAVGSPRPAPIPSGEQIERGDRLFDSRQYLSALDAYKLAAFSASAEEDPGRFVEGAAQVAHTYARLGRPEEGRPWLDGARERADPEDAVSWGRWLLVRGVYEDVDGQRAAALASFEEAYELARSSGQTVRAVQAAHLASVVAEDEVQLRWCRSAIDLSREVGDADLEAALWSQLAWLLEDRALHGDALVAFERAQRLVRRVGDEHSRLVADWSYAHALRLAGRPRDARVVLEDVAARAERNYLTRRRPNDAEWVGHCQRELGELEVLEGRPRAGLELLEEARRNLVSAGIREQAPASLAALDRRIAEVRQRLRQR